MLQLDCFLMKKFLLFILPIGVTAFVANVSSTTLLAAEPDQEQPRRPGPPGDGPRGQRPFQFQGGPQGAPQGGGAPLESVFTQEQRMEFGREMRSQGEKLRELNEGVSKLRRELDDLMLAEKFDETLFREKSGEMAALEAERTVMRARAFAKVRPSLTEEQLERIKTLRAEMGQSPQRGPRSGGEGGFRPQRPFRSQEERGSDDVLPPPAPPSPPRPPEPPR